MPFQENLPPIGPILSRVGYESVSTPRLKSHESLDAQGLTVSTEKVENLPHFPAILNRLG